MRISLIAAMSCNRVIGINNQLPWHLSADLQRFKRLTLNKSIIMGKNTYLSIGKPLPQRDNIVITSDQSFHPTGIRAAHSIEQALALANKEEEVMIIGGASIYAQTLNLATKLYLTIICQEFQGDAFFPELESNRWQVTAEETHVDTEKSQLAYRFVDYQKI